MEFSLISLLYILVAVIAIVDIMKGAFARGQKSAVGRSGVRGPGRRDHPFIT